MCLLTICLQNQKLHLTRHVDLGPVCCNFSGKCYLICFLLCWLHCRFKANSSGNLGLLGRHQEHGFMPVCLFETWVQGCGLRSRTPNNAMHTQASRWQGLFDALQSLGDSSVAMFATDTKHCIALVVNRQWTQEQDAHLEGHDWSNNILLKHEKLLVLLHMFQSFTLQTTNMNCASCVFYVF